MTMSGQDEEIAALKKRLAIKSRSNEDLHVCTPPPGFAPRSGLLWICPDCWSEFVFRPVVCRELGGRILNLWVRYWDPKGQGWVPLDRRRRHRKRGKR